MAFGLVYTITNGEFFTLNKPPWCQLAILVIPMYSWKQEHRGAHQIQLYDLIRNYCLITEKLHIFVALK